MTRLASLTASCVWQTTQPLAMNSRLPSSACGSGTTAIGAAEAVAWVVVHVNPIALTRAAASVIATAHGARVRTSASTPAATPIKPAPPTTKGQGDGAAVFETGP